MTGKNNKPVQKSLFCAELAKKWRLLDVNKVACLVCHELLKYYLYSYCRTKLTNWSKRENYFLYWMVFKISKGSIFLNRFVNIVCPQQLKFHFVLGFCRNWMVNCKRERELWNFRSSSHFKCTLKAGNWMS